MRLSYFHSPDRVPAEGMADAAVAIDVLRATTTMAWALHNGAEAIQAFADLAQLDAAASAWPNDQSLRAGERGGQKLDGFDLGNSPLAVTPERVGGRRIFMSTTHGPRALDRVRSAPMLLTAALVNRSAVAQRLLQHRPEQIWMVGSGWEGAYSLEDSLAAGALADALLEGSGRACWTWPATMKPAPPMPSGSNGKINPKPCSGWPATASACRAWATTMLIWLAARRLTASRWFRARTNRVFCG